MRKILVALPLLLVAQTARAAEDVYVFDAPLKWQLTIMSCYEKLGMKPVSDFGIKLVFKVNNDQVSFNQTIEVPSPSLRMKHKTGMERCNKEAESSQISLR